MQQLSKFILLQTSTCFGHLLFTSITRLEGEFRRCLGMWEEVTGEWRKMHSEQLHDLQSPPTVTGVIKRKTMR
jgi:hypothetical protein